MGRKRKGQPGRPTKGKEYEKQRKENVEPKEFQRLFSFHFCFSIPSLWLAWPCGRQHFYYKILMESHPLPHPFLRFFSWFSFFYFLWKENEKENET